MVNDFQALFTLENRLAQNSTSTRSEQIRLQGTAVARAMAVVGAWKASWGRIQPIGPLNKLSLIVMAGSHSESIDCLCWGKKAPISGISSYGLQGRALNIIERLASDVAPWLIKGDGLCNIAGAHNEEHLILPGQPI